MKEKFVNPFEVNKIKQQYKISSKICIDDTCFMFRYFIHLDPDTDVCNITGNITVEARFFDSPRCEDFEICMGEDNA